MASMVAKASSGQVCPPMLNQEKGSRNKRKFRADPPANDGPTKTLSSSTQTECPSYGYSSENFEMNMNHGHTGACDICGVAQDRSEALKLDLGLSSGLGSSDLGTCCLKGDSVAHEFHDADWSDLTETQLEELVLSNLDAIFKSAIKKIVACGYSEEVATKAVLRSGLYYGCKDTVSNVVDNTLAYLRNGQEVDSSKENYFEDLKQLEKYILAELVCVLREVRPFFSNGDAMWCLLISDMNVSHACTMDSDPLSGFFSSEIANGSTCAALHPEAKAESNATQASLPSPSVPGPSNPCKNRSQLDMDKVSRVARANKIKSSLNGLASGKNGSTASSLHMDRPFSAVGSSQIPASEEKFVASRKIHSGTSKRDSILRQKSLHLEKSHRTYGVKGSSRSGKLSGLGGLFFDKKLKSMSDSASVHFKHCSIKISNGAGVDVPHEFGALNLQANSLFSSSTTSSLDAPSSLSPKSVQAVPMLPKPENSLTTPLVNSPALIPLPTDTELSLSLATKCNVSPLPANCDTVASNCSCPEIDFDLSLVKWAPQEKKAELITNLIPRVQELQNQLQEWTEWANQKVMQAARRLGKDKAELKTLRQEKEEVERLKKEKQTLEENTMKKLSEMENALSKASGQVDRANAAVRRLEVENAALRQEMEVAKLRAAESAASCQEVSKREKKTLMKFQSWEKQKTLFQEELAAERRKLAELKVEVEQAQDTQLQLEARWKQEEKAKDEMLTQANSTRKEREQLEASAKAKEEAIKSKAEFNLQKYKDDIQKLEKDISRLRLKMDSSKIAALRRGIDGSYVSKVTNLKFSTAVKESHALYLSVMENELDDFSGTGGVKRERECVMCLSEEMSVVFLPCAHQVVCTTCNELHEKQGMKDCPSCRSPIQCRISARFGRP
ncbi:hypothetical protein Droror1_Dr00007772 [Drosera rotundifolia]